VRRAAGAWLLLTLLAVACAILAARLLSVPEFGAPFYLVFVLVGLAGLVGPSRDEEVAPALLSPP
jgi:NhaP-type Na+/H+ and K+/H+ antiporter